MGDGSDETVGDTGHIYRRRIEPASEDANYRLLRLIANVERTDVTDLPPMYDRIDDLVTELFEEPPSPAAQVKLEFSYHGYRIEMDQSGNVSLMKLEPERMVEHRAQKD